MKYPKLEEPCLSCQLKCGRVEAINFVKDENCKYRRNPIQEINKILGIQIKIKM